MKIEEKEEPKEPEIIYKEVPFTEKDYKLRKPSTNYELIKRLEDMALSVMLKKEVEK